MTRVLVTGCTGFVGRAFCEAARRSGYQVRGAVRVASTKASGLSDQVMVGDIGHDTDWSAALEGVDLVVHLAAKAHVVKSLADDTAFMECNARGTQTLVEAAAAAGVRRFVYMSSIKVNGEETRDRPFTPLDEPAPRDAYGRSKLCGEKAVGAASSRMETVIVRPPLVYGPGVRANFAQMMRWVYRGWPLPLAAISNARSLVSIWNLVDLVVCTLEHTAAPGRTFMVSDGMDLSTPELLRLMGRSLGRPVRLVGFPVGMLRFGARSFGVTTQIDKLCGSLQADISATRRLLGWAPPLSVEDSLARTAAAFLAARSRT